MVTETKIRELLEGRPVFVTGADGFIGSHLVELLLNYNADVFAFIRATSSGALHHLYPVQQEITILRGDLSDKSAVMESLKVLKVAAKKTGIKPIIFHLGAQAHVGESWKRPYETLYSNTIGTINILQSILDLELDIYKLDTAGTSEEYGNIHSELKDAYKLSLIHI